MQPIFQEHTCLTQNELTAYLNGDLSPADRFRVENHLLDCPLCEDAVEGQRLIHTQAPQKVKALNPKRRWLRAAAAILLVAASLTSLRLLLNNSDNNLYSAFFESYPNEMDQQLRSSNTDEEIAEVSEDLLNAFTQYDAGNFEESLASFENEITSNTNSAIASFYGGLAALETGNTPKAKVLLEAASQPGSIYEAEAKWYLALALLQEGKRNDASELLDQLAADPNGRYFEKAKALRSKF